jgi:hypothetical protein
VPWVGVPTVKDLGDDRYEISVVGTPTTAILQTVMHTRPSDAGPGDPILPNADQNLAALRDAQNANRTILILVLDDPLWLNVVDEVCSRSGQIIKCVGD